MSSNGQPIGLAALHELDDSAFLDLLTGSGVEMRAIKGQLRISAPVGALSEDLKEELRRRKPSLLLLLERRVEARPPDDPENIGQWTAQIIFWKAKLADAPMLLELPFSQPRPATSSFQTESIHSHLPQDLLVSLQRLAHGEAVPCNTLLLAAWVALLYRYTGQEDLCIGAPASPANTMVLRLQPRPSSTFHDLLQHVHSTAHDAAANSDLPFAELTRHLQPYPEPSTSPLIQVLFDLDLRGSDLLSSSTSNPSHLDLAIHFSHNSDRSATAIFEYRADLFSAESIRQLAQSYVTLLHSIVSQPGATIATLNILTEAQHHQLLVDWNQTQLAFPKDALIHSLFEQQAVQTPDAIAILCGGQSITYAGLNTRANQLAHILLQRGLQSQECVAICMNRSISMIAAMLAVLKAGGAYLPLDPAYPPQRLAVMLEDSRAKIVVSEDAVLQHLSLGASDTIRIDAEAATIAQQSQSNPSIAVEPNHLAYVIYTSGSTGRPKGVAIEHHSTVSFLHWGRQTFAPAELARVVASTSISFDLSVFEIFLPLAWGHAILLVDGILQLPQAAASSPTLINTVPSAMSALLTAGSLPASVLCINLAGEPLPSSLVHQIEVHAPAARIFDLYGPTETTTYSTFALRHADLPATIGRPLANTQIYLLDANLQPVPVGVPGQMFIGGEGVARGYLHQPALTAERFVTLNRLSSAGRVYQTGDLARYRPDGNIEYLGRIDHQVKIRGFRIELGEIENTLRRHPQVTEAVVVVQHDETLGRSLAAYITSSGASPDPQQLIEIQRQSLPSYMVVTEITILEKLPLTPNNKIDRKALMQRRPNTVDLSAAAAPRGPATDTERRLTRIWEKHFQRTPIGLDEDFFAIGGHSLLAFQIFAEIEKRMHTPLMLAVLFEAPTIRRLACEIDRKRAGIA